jgi:hypothetical protein
MYRFSTGMLYIHATRKKFSKRYKPLDRKKKRDNIEEYSSCFSPSDSSTLKGFLSSLFK